MTVLEIPTPDPRTFDDVSREFAQAVASRYAIKKLIGRGGMGMVYLARDRRLDRLVAIKTLPPQVAEDESVRQRFLRETRMAGALSHPNIVPIHGADEVDGHAFFVMALVDGDSLADRIRTEARLDATVTARILRDVAAALEHAHERGIIHRDVKAENILLDRATGRALVTDFGIARLAEAAPLTATGQVLGTVYYTSPEQVTGDPIDARSDLYSLGVVGFLALTGTFPFDAELASAVLIAHVNKKAPRVRSVRPDVPESLASIIDRCLAKSPAQRFKSARELCEALDAVLREKPAAALARADARMSDTQAQKVWQRAAELQAGEPLTSGVPLGHVRDAGREAGIATSFLDRALAEREQALEDSSKRSWWAGVPLEVELRADVEREIEPRDFARVLSILRAVSRDGGTTIASNREIAWRSEGHTYWLDASIVPADGNTNVLLSLSLRRMAAKVLAASVVVGAVAGTLTTAIALLTIEFAVGVREVGRALDVTRPMAEAIAVLLGVGVGLAVLPLGRLLARRWYRGAFARLAELRDALVSNIETTTPDD